MKQVKVGSLRAQVAFYGFAGLNHFINPAFYLPLIPPFFPFPEMINWVSGGTEVLLAIGLGIPITRRWTCYLILAMLVAFIPSHLYFIQVGSCIPNGLCVPQWAGWLRLVVIHPLLMGWAWWHRQ